MEDIETWLTNLHRRKREIVILVPPTVLQEAAP